MKPGQDGAGLPRNLSGAEGHHHDPARASARPAEIQPQVRAGAGKVGAPLLQEHLAPGLHLLGAGPGGAEGQVQDADRLQAGQGLALDIPVRQPDFEDPVIGPGDLRGPGRGPGARNGIAPPPAPREGENSAG